jgi:hypothetical protein
MRKLTGFVLGVLLSSSVPALASGLVLGEPRMPTWRAAESSAAGKYGCSLDLYLQTQNSLSQFVREESAFDSPSVDDRWKSGATYQWNAGVNRAVDHLFMPPDQVQLHVTQTGEDLRGHYESTNSPNETFAAFEVVIH